MLRSPSPIKRIVRISYVVRDSIALEVRVSVLDWDAIFSEEEGVVLSYHTFVLRSCGPEKDSG